MCKGTVAFCSPVQEEEHDTDLGVVRVLEDCEVHAAHEPVKARGEAAPNGAELLKPIRHLVIDRQADYAYCHSPLCASRPQIGSNQENAGSASGHVLLFFRHA